MEHPVVAVGNFGNVSKFKGTDSLYWEFVDDNEMLSRLVSQVNIDHPVRPRNIITPALTNVGDMPISTNINYTPTKEECTSTNTVPSDEIELPITVNDEPTDIYVQSINTDAVIKSNDAPVDISTSTRDDYGPISKITLKMQVDKVVQEAQMLHADMLDSVVDRDKIINEEWLYFIDSGGQIQYQQVLHPFLQCVSVLLLVMNMAEGFSSQSSTVLQRDNDHQLKVSDYSLSNEAVLEQLVVMVNSNFKEQKELIENDPYLSAIIKIPKKLQIMAIATHLDELLEKSGDREAVKQREMEYASILQSMQSNLHYASTSELFYKVNGKKAEVGDFSDKAIAEICQQLRKKEVVFEVEVPLYWHAFEIVLRKAANKVHGVLPLDACYKIGEKLYRMDTQEVQSALKFFHLLNTVLYYADSKASDVVFGQTNLVYKIISELAICICQIRHEMKDTGNPDMNKAANGHICENFLKMSMSCKTVCDYISNFNSVLISLFVELSLAVPVGDDKYFIPALLPLIDPSGVPNSFMCPFIFYFQEGAPMGFFCTYIVHLLSKHSQHGQRHWVIPQGVNIHANCITLRRVDKCEVLFIGYRNKFEVRCNLQYRREIKDELCKAMDEFSKVKPQRGFYCICKDKKMSHIAFEKDEFCLYCSVTHESVRCTEYNRMHSCWSWCTSQFKDEFGKLT